MKTGRSASAAPSCPDWLARGSMRHMVSVEIDRVEQFHLGELSSAIADGAGASRLGAPAGSRPAAAKEATADSPEGKGVSSKGQWVGVAAGSGGCWPVG